MLEGKYKSAIQDMLLHHSLPPAYEGWGKVLFSVCQSTPRLGGGGGYPHPRSGRGGCTPHPRSGWGSTPSQVRMGVPAVSGMRVLPPPPPPIEVLGQDWGDTPNWNSMVYLLRVGLYASWVQPGRLSCAPCNYIIVNLLTLDKNFIIVSH